MRTEANPLQDMAEDSWSKAPGRLLRRTLRQLKRDYDKVILAILGFVLFFVIWHYASVAIDNPALPTPGKVLHALGESFKSRPAGDLNPWTMQQHVAASLKRILYGSALAIILAVPLGLLMGFSKRVEALFIFPLELIRPIPPIAWLAFAIAMFATGLDVVFIIFLGIFFPIFVNTMDGVKKVDPMLVDAAQTLGARRLQVFYKVILPAVVPQTMTGVRVGVGVGWMTIVAAEMVGVSPGLGWFIWTYGQLGLYDLMFAGMLMLGIISIVIARLLIALERWLQR